MLRKHRRLQKCRGSPRLAYACMQFKINLTSLLDSLNVFSHSLVRDNPVEIEYRRGDALQLWCASPPTARRLLWLPHACML